MKSLMSLWSVLANESASWCSTSATMDIKTVHRRVKHEGLSFLTITLTNFGKDFERSLDQGYVDRHLFQGFSWKGGLPRLFGGFLDLVFDRSSGRLLDDPSVDAVRSVRQLTLMFGKLLVPCSDARTRAAFRQYIECEKEVRLADASRNQASSLDFDRISRLVAGKDLRENDRLVYSGELAPKHGPGATADGTYGNQKYDSLLWTTRLEELFPCGDFLLPNCSEKYLERLDRVSLLEPEAEIPVKVITVPKTLKTPRVIAMEPTYMTYVQQGLMRNLVESIERSDTLSHFLGFSDQTVNQRMAREGSLWGTLATLDLSEASDRVSNQHVRMLLASTPWLAKAVDACRSQKADVPGYGVQHLAKFASMGSSLCFPMEALVFLVVILMGIEKEINRPLTSRDLHDLRGKVRVYGDDIIVPVEYVETVVNSLQNEGFVVNLRKSFWSGRFRESCGKEYYAGEDVSIVRFRRVFPTQLQHTDEVESLVSFRNQLYLAGYWETCRYLDAIIVRLIKYFPVVESTSPLIGRTSFIGYRSQRTHPTLHKPLVRGLRRESRSPISRLDGPGALLKFHLQKIDEVRDIAIYPDPSRTDVDGSPSRLALLEPKSDTEHLVRAGRPRSASLRPRWDTPY